MNKIIILVSFRNEEENIKKFVHEVEKSFSFKNISNYEILFIDDYSSDNSFNILRELSKKNNKIKIIKMKKRYGHSHSIQAGLENLSPEDFCVLIDCDLQDPPILIAENLNFDDEKTTIHFVRKNRDDSFFQKIYSFIAYMVLNFISFGKIINNAGYFKIIPPSIINSLKSNKEYLPYWNYLITKYSINNKIIYYTRGKRYSGNSKFGILTLNPWMTYFGGLYYFKYNFIILSSIFMVLIYLFNNSFNNFYGNAILNLLNFFIFSKLILFLFYLTYKKRREKIKCEYELINFS
ncbi:glycosyltransferase [Candidatus Pelagibacter sp.]|nr:glycosyltransferase [Candidatus Pelagibacter sp.]